MASVQANISKGSEVGYYDNVDNNTPTNSALIMFVLASGSTNGLNGLVDFATLAAVLAGGYTEVTNTGYARKTLTDADLTAKVVDNVNNRILLTLPLQTFGSPNVAAGMTWDLVGVAYDNDTTGGTDANIIPITFGEIRQNGTAIVPNAAPVIIDFSSGWIAAV